MRALRLTFFLLLVTGCARWSQKGDVTLEETLQLPAPKLANDGVLIEVAQVSVDSRRLESIDLWSRIDENIVPRDRRRILNDNGIRVGRIGGQLPDELNELLLSRNEFDVRTESGAGLKLDGRSRFETIQTRAGRTKEVMIGSTRETLSVLSKEDGMVRGETLKQAQCVFKVRASPQTEGNVQMQLTPEIVYGPTRQAWTGVEGAWKLSPERQRKIYEQLQLAAPLAPGETLLLAATDDKVGLGGHFFAPDGSSQLLVLVRLAQSRWNPLFSDDGEDASIVTPLE